MIGLLEQVDVPPDAMTYLVAVALVLTTMSGALVSVKTATKILRAVLELCSTWRQRRSVCSGCGRCMDTAPRSGRHRRGVNR